MKLTLGQIFLNQDHQNKYLTRKQEQKRQTKLKLLQPSLLNFLTNIYQHWIHLHPNK
jgi:hypothetical protein